ncbi:DUF5590 domain-containing protein [Halobacillus sp. ACCC02827]|uniref:cell wall elongation regulator TseB-like domain-containing protein n=1 Tax=unclassified Halobacillus TaxID=2636472 RepID=UPI0012677276|nr:MULTISPECIES: DUF5590 domain-containing protein [unclassified Halobacillus]WJE14064.1 DUF5590 domain-containing protein [Halobacillus sp. ACCC02827]
MMTMLRQQSSRFTVPKWVWFSLTALAVVLLLGVSFLVWMYTSISHDREAGQTEAEALALAETDLANVENVSTYNGNIPIHIVKGSTENGTEQLAFLDLSEKKVLKVEDMSGQISPEAMRQQWQQSCASCQFKDIQYGYEEQEPVFQLTYIDEQNRYVFDYFTLSGDNFDQRFAFKRTQ